MRKATNKKIGIFLGRLQPQHPGHEAMIKRIFKENDEVVLCVGSAQKIAKNDPLFSRNPLSARARLKTLQAFLEAQNFSKPYAIVTAKDIEPDSAWPAFLKKRCRLADDTVNTVYFADRIFQEYETGLREVGFRIKFINRKKFKYQTAQNTLHKISSATEIRELTKRPGSFNPIPPAF